MNATSSQQRIMCVSHLKDVDGCVCAAVIRCAVKANVLLTNYGNIISCFNQIRHNYDHIYVCDLGLNEQHVPSFKRLLQFAKITYIDHHQLSTHLLTTFHKLGIEVIHDIKDCATALTFQHFQDMLPQEAGIFACYSAIADRLEDGPIAQKILNKFDRDFVLFETTLLIYAIAQADITLKKYIINQLAKLKYPHQIKDVPKLALEQVKKISKLRKELPLKAKKLRNLTYVETQGESLGIIANILLDVCNASVSICYNNDVKKNHSDISIRGKPHLQIDLAFPTSKIAQTLGGFGGGHPLACGARIPNNKVKDFINALDSQIELLMECKTH